MYLKNIGDYVRSLGESIGTPLEPPPIIWLDNISDYSFLRVDSSRVKERF
jgi:hypothetical protein